ncbi:MAG: multiheme c-type cytochrome [Candidatus Kryptoniota bacterium]
MLYIKPRALRLSSCSLTSTCLVMVFAAIVLSANETRGEQPGASTDSVSSQTQDCIDCHAGVTPGIVRDWKTSLHSQMTVREAMMKPAIQRRVSADSVNAGLRNHIVGCYECHSQNTDKHKDSFDHFGYRINVIVSPNDCATCHPVEVSQYEASKKANAYANLMENPVYHKLVSTIDGMVKIKGEKIVSDEPSETALNESCLGCHGSVVKVIGTDTIHSSIGDVAAPKLSNWPNQGVGRINPDGSKGTCTSCHTRHSFSIAIARKPYTCAQCHLEPDVPAWEVYSESKHGNIFLSKGGDWNMTDVPWVVGKDFQAPTCASCHNSLLVSEDGTVIAQRNHDFGSRLWVRLFGLIYSHPQPKSGNTTIIRNQDGVPLPTTFDGRIASSYLIDSTQQANRQGAMETICESCHSTPWVRGHFDELDTMILETDGMTKAATEIVEKAWHDGVEDPVNPFDESIEKMWVEQWLFYANTMRYSAAMTGAPDYQAFKHGWWDMQKNLQEMKDMLDLKLARRNKPIK